MGCDIHSYVEVKRNGQWEKVGNIFRGYYDEDELIDEPFYYRSYGLFGFLADVRNYSVVPVISQPKGIPSDISTEVKKELEEWDSDAHSLSCLTLKELLDFNYDQKFIDMRAISDAPKISVKDFLGEKFSKLISQLQTLGDPENVRVVFWFDN